MTLRRTSGYLCILAALTYFLGQAIAITQWEGLYLLSDYLVDDLGIAACDAVEDAYTSRYVCSPGHDWFSAGLILSGIFFLTGAISLIAQGRTGADTAEPTGLVRASGLGVLLIAAALITGGAFGLSRGEAQLEIGILIGTWLAVGSLFIGARRAAWSGRITTADANLLTGARPLLPSRPLLHGFFQPFTLLLAVLSGVGLVLFSLANTHYGLWQRLAFDSAMLAWIFVGASLLSDAPTRKTQARHAERQRLQQEKDAAVIRAQRP